MTALRLELLERRDAPAADFHTLPVFPAADPAILDHMRSVAAVGQSLGRRTDVFLKIGDSNTDAQPFFNNGYLNSLGPGFNPVSSGLSAHGLNLVNAWSVFSNPIGDGSNSFSRTDLTAAAGYQVPSVLPLLDSEIAAIRPGVALIMLGTNDATVGISPPVFRNRLEALISRLINAGVVPIVSTIPENLAYGAGVQATATALNQVIADATETWRVPLWNFNRQLGGLPLAGLKAELLHLSTSPNGGGRFTNADLLYGQNVHNLGALAMLDWYRLNVANSAIPFVAPLPNWTSLAGHTVYAVGLDAGQLPIVSVYDSITHQELNRFVAFESSFLGGVRVAVADVNGDGVPDIVCGAGPGGGPVVAVFSGLDGSRLATILAYEGSFRGGVGSVAARDLDGDGAAEIAVGAGNGGGPVIAIYSGRTFVERQRFLAYDASFRGGVNVTLGNFEGLGATIITGAGIGGGPHVRFFRADSNIAERSYFADWIRFTGGITIAAGDLDHDGYDELATARATGGSEVTIIDPATLKELRRIPGHTANTIAGVRLAMITDGTGRDLVIANGPGAAVRLDSYFDLNAGSVTLSPNEPTRGYGVFVG